MAIGDDFAISAAKAITYTGNAHGVAGAGYYTVIQFHRWLADLADDAVASGDDLLDITNLTPSDRSTDNIITLINGYNIDQTSSEHLFDGSIIQAGGDDVWDGLVVIAAEGMDLQILQSGLTLTSDFWNNIPDGESTKGLNRDTANGISTRFMLKVRTAAADLDGRRIIGNTRQTGFTYSEFKVNGTARGNNVLALTFASDLNDTEDASGWTAIDNTTEGYALIDIDGNGAPEPYYSEWNKDTFTINQFYERMKYITRSEETATLYGLTGEDFRGITHELAITPGTGTWSAFEEVSWTGGSGQMLAVDDVDATATSKLWIQILTGTAPSSGTITGVSTANGTVTGNTERTVSTPFCGVSTGSALIGSYGFGLEASDTSASDTFFDLNNAQRTPPNNISFTVEGVVSGEDRVLVGPKGAGTTLETGQFSLLGSLTGGEASITVDAGTETPGTGTDSEKTTPSTGSIRVQRSLDGVYELVTYTGYTVGAGTMTFTGCSGTPAATDDAEIYISYLDVLAAASSESFTIVASGTRDLFIRVRDGGTAGDNEGIKTFETVGALVASSSSTTVIRTSDV